MRLGGLITRIRLRARSAFKDRQFGILERGQTARSKTSDAAATESSRNSIRISHHPCARTFETQRIQLQTIPEFPLARKNLLPAALIRETNALLLDNSHDNLDQIAILRLLQTWQYYLKSLNNALKLKDPDTNQTMIAALTAFHPLALAVLQQAGLPLGSYQVAATTGITGWTLVADHSAAAAPNAHELFDAFPVLKQQFLDNNHFAIRLRKDYYRCLLQAWSKSSDPTADVRMKEIFAQAVQEGNDFGVDILSSTLCDIMLKMCAERGDEHGVRQLWQIMLDRGIQPTSYSYDMYIKVYECLYERKRDASYARRATDLYGEALAVYTQAQPRDARLCPRVTSLQALVGMHMDEPSKVYQLINNVISFETNCPEARGRFLDADFFRKVMLKFRDCDLVEEAEVLLNIVADLDHIEGYGVLFGIVMYGYANRGTQVSLQKVETMLVELESAEQRSLTVSGKSTRALDVNKYNALLLAYQKTLGKNAVDPVRQTINRMFKSSRELQNPALRPDCYSFNTLMQTLILRSGPDYLSYVLKTLEFLESDTRYQSRAGRRELSSSYNTVMNAIAKSYNSGSLDLAAAIFKRIVEPDCFGYNSYMSLLSNNGRTEQVLALFDDMRAKSIANKSLLPNSVTYSIVFTSLKRSRALGCWETGAAVFEFMMVQYAAGDHHSKPTYKSIIPLFQLLEVNPDPTSKYLEARKIMNHLDELSVTHTAGTLDAFIRACSATTGSDYEKRQAFVCIVEAIHQYSIVANDVVFDSALSACSDLIASGDARDEIVNDLFQLCATCGCVSARVLVRLQKLCTPELYARITSLNNAGSVPELVGASKLPLQ
jgi:pentatricopeptide repeat protein